MQHSDRPVGVKQSRTLARPTPLTRDRRNRVDQLGDMVRVGLGERRRQGIAVSIGEQPVHAVGLAAIGRLTGRTVRVGFSKDSAHSAESGAADVSMCSLRAHVRSFTSSRRSRPAITAICRRSPKARRQAAAGCFMHFCDTPKPSRRCMKKRTSERKRLRVQRRRRWSVRRRGHHPGLHKRLRRI